MAEIENVQAEREGGSHPYSALPDHAFCRTTIGDRSFFDLEKVFSPKFKFTREALN